MEMLNKFLASVVPDVFELNFQLTTEDDVYCM